MPPHLIQVMSPRLATMDCQTQPQQIEWMLTLLRRIFMVLLIMVFLNIGKIVIAWAMWRRPLVSNVLAFVIPAKPRLTRMTL